MQLAMTVGGVVLAGIVVVALIGFLFEKYAGKLEQEETQRDDHAGSKEPAYTANKR
ncbi:MAG TPA: hypothetical protein VH436_05320 [Vicinamibacterales bacterium]|jgi:hypothetical protein